jgi:CO/xanthine dehydrogenase Mo-binding subunit
MSQLIGQPVDRIDGMLKVTGSASYAADFPEARLAHAVLVTSTVASGTIASIDTRRAQALAGVLLVMTWQNAMRLPNGGHTPLAPPAGRRLTLLQDNVVRYSHDATDARFRARENTGAYAAEPTRPPRRFATRRCRRGPARRRGAHRRGLHHARAVPQSDGAARQHGALGRPRTHAL